MIAGLVSANDALVVKLLAPEESGLRQIASFNPEFTYPIFGDDEQIFGYKNPKLELRYRANDMRPHVKFSSSGKLKTVGEAEPTDVVGLLRQGNHLPKGSCSYYTHLGMNRPLTFPASRLRQAERF